MANLLEQIGQGLRSGLRVAGAGLSPRVYESQEREREQFEQLKARRDEMLMEATVRAVQDGALAPEKAQRLAQAKGWQLPPLGPGVQAQKFGVELQDRAAAQQQRSVYEKAIHDYETKATYEPPPEIAKNPDLLEVWAKRQLVDDYMRRAELATQYQQEDDAKRWRELAQTEIQAQRLTQEQKGDSALQQKIQALMDSGLSETQAKGIAAGRYVVSVNPVSGERQVVDIATGRPVGGVPRQGPQQPAGTAISPGTDIAAATGPSGFFGNIANTITDALGFGLAYPDVEQAKNALDNLKVQTTTLMQAAVPGRPSVELIRRLDKIAVDPVSLMQGDARAQNRLQQTRDMLSTEISRMERDILSKPQDFRPDQLTETRLNYSQLVQLQKEYDTVLGSFERRFNKEKKTGIFQEGDRWVEYENGKAIYRWPSRESYENYKRATKEAR